MKLSKNTFKRLTRNKYSWIVVTTLFVCITYAATFFSYKIDLTSDKRFSLTQPTIDLLHHLDKPIEIKVFLTGDLPSDYKKLSVATKDILTEFKSCSNNNVHVSFEDISSDLQEKEHIYDSLARLGVMIETSETISSGKSIQQLIVPFALAIIDNKKPIAIDLRSSRTIFKQFNVVNDMPQEDKEATRNAAEALLEFKFINAIDKLTRQYVPTVAYAVGNGEPVDLSINDLGESLRNEYRLAILDLKKYSPTPREIDALLIVKPTQPFTDEDKLKIDQYIMHGGKVIWCIDKLYAELDSLMRSRADFVAYDRNLNIDDMLFRYGVRINSDLVQDLNCSKVPVVTGSNPDGSPRMQRIPWPYYPFLASAANDNPISKNIDRVISIFPASIDTVMSEGIKKTVLLASDTNSRVLGSPAIISLNSVKSEEDLRMFNRSYVPVAVLLEGKFRSLFANRITGVNKEEVAQSTGMPFAESAAPDGKQIVISDADIVTNSVSRTTGVLPMGMIPFENYRFANKEFFLNSIDYLVSNNSLFEARNKDFTLHLLNKQKISEQRLKWQIIVVIAPIAIVMLFGVAFQFWRKKTFSKFIK